MAAAMQSDLGKKWTILKTQWRFFLWSLWISSGVVMQGFDLVGGIQLSVLPEFRRKFGVCEQDGECIIPAHYLAAWNSIAPACEIILAFLFAPFIEKFGRKPGILIAALASTTGILLQQLAGNWRVHLAGRGVNGIAIGIMFMICPLWIGETCLPELRGFFLCFFNTSIVFGQFAIVILTKMSIYLTGKWQWWLPLTGMYVFPLLLISGFVFFPESPYWLLRQNKIAETQKSLRKIYGPHNSEIYMSRMQQDICTTRDSQGNIYKRTTCGIDISASLECFRGVHRKRTLTAIFIATAQQLSGASFVVGYTTYFLSLIGLKDFFDMSVLLYLAMLLAATATFPLTEIIGRRTLIVGPQFILCLLLLLIGIMGFITNHKSADLVVVTSMYVWAVLYQISIGTTGFVLASEIATARLRGATQGFVTVSNAAWGLIMQFTIPYMINPDAGNLGAKVGFIFFGTSLVSAIGGFFLFPETKGISFETLDALYELNVSPRIFERVVVSRSL